MNCKTYISDIPLEKYIIMFLSFNGCHVIRGEPIAIATRRMLFQT